MFALTWLPEILQAAGLKVAETPDWRTRGRGDMGALKGVMCHHTATPKSVRGNMPTLDLLIKGRAASATAPALTGPLAQLGLGRDGTYYVIAAGRANHAGAGRWQGLVDVGNTSFIGIEAENSGLADDLPWPDIQLDAYCRGVAALLQRIGAGPSMCCGHKEYATPAHRKTDPDLDMAVFRSRVAAYLGGSPSRALVAATDDKQRPTLRRGDSGDAVTTIQGLLGVAQTGHFDGVTEAALRRWQGEHRLVADGIMGPASWTVLQPPAGGAPGAAAPSAAPSAAPARPAQAPADAAPPMPPAATAATPVTVTGMFAQAPDGTRFARRSGPGFFTIVETKLADWLGGAAGASVGGTGSQKRVVAAMSINEGGLEAVNSYDDSYMSFGVFQWTAGAQAAAGELAALLTRFARENPAAYADCFGDAGLTPEMDGNTTTGYLTLNGIVLRSAADKEQLRDVAWAYRFWRAGHHPALRRCEAELAVSRIGRFIDSEVEGRPLRTWLTSELGIALVLDEHVNRPGHVPGTLAGALRSVAATLPRDPAEWTTREEHTLILAYLDARRDTSMTGSDKRANSIMALATQNALSDARQSYVDGN